MATPAFAPTPNRLAANRLNAQRSTGPRTVAGKERVRLNALKHGALSRTVVFPHEDQSAFDALGAKLAADYRPATPEQRELLTAIQNTHWRLDRVLSLEGHLHTVGLRNEVKMAAEQFSELDHNGHVEIARAWDYQNHARQFEQLNRQETRLRRLLNQQVADYIDLQSAQAEPEPEPCSGFVSQNAPDRTSSARVKPSSLRSNDSARATINNSPRAATVRERAASETGELPRRKSTT